MQNQIIEFRDEFMSKNNSPSLLALCKSLIIPFLSLTLMMLGSGLLNTFTSIRLEMAGYSIETIGVVTSALYVGILIGAIWLDRWISEIGHRPALIAFCTMSIFLVMAQAIWIDAIYWCIIRFGAGICLSGIFIVIESWLLLESPLPMRGRILSIYLFIFYGGLSAGQFLINIAPLNTIYPFCITAIFFTASLIPTLIQTNSEPKPEITQKVSLIELFNISPLGFLGGIISGMLLAAIYGLVPVYGAEIKMKVSEIAIWMAVIIFGGMIFQWPLGVWADKGNRRKVLNFSALIAALLALAISLLPRQFSLTLLLLSWFFGGASFAIYPLSMGFTCAKINKEQIVAATGGFVLVYGVGAIIGPLLAPIAITLFGISGLFYFYQLFLFFSP